MIIDSEKENGIVYRGVDDILGYNGWPSICIDSEGVLYSVCSVGIIGHICHLGKTLLLRSTDRERKWSVHSIVNDTPLDDRDAGFVCLRGKTTFCFIVYTSC